MNRDIRSNLKPILAFNAVITSNTTTTGTIIDTADYDGGLKFDFLCAEFSAGTFTPLIYEGDDSGLSDKSAVADANMIPQSGGEAAAALTAASVGGATLESIGLIGTKRYIRVDIVSTGASGDNYIIVTAEASPEVKKAV